MKLSKCTGAVVFAVTPYRHDMSIDLPAFTRYIRFLADQGARTIVVPSRLSDPQELAMAERGALVEAAVRTAGETAMIVASVIPGEMSAGEQAAFYLEKGADAINIHYPTSDVDAFREAFSQVAATGTDYILVTDSKSGGFDMNSIAKGIRPAVGLPDDVITELFRDCPAFRSLIASFPLNECGPCSSRPCP